MSDANGRSGVIEAAFGRHYEVRLATGETCLGYPKGKRSSYACGDRVSLNADGQITGHEARRTFLYRSDAWREKLLAANVSQLLIVVATEPSFSDELLSRALVAGESQNLRSVIVLNKADLCTALPAAIAQLDPFAALGYPVLALSAKADISALRPFLTGQASVVIGQSGMGKSTLVNALVPTAAAATREISTALDTGKHTTTCTRWYALGAHGDALIDSPGVQAFGLAHLSLAELETGFIEFRPYLGQCRYRDCRHDREPGCAIKGAAEQGGIHPRRLAHFHVLAAEHDALPKY